ncbi:MAG: aminodeoxychorismate synthase component I [Burkholderiaceae bacterium]|nr:aminodeoxychorismate synthase component I [Burkholderiaceae bacterium]
MSHCRFEDRLTQHARVLTKPLGRIVASKPEELSAAFAQIEAARQAGYWVALLLEYELGEWLEPALAQRSHQASANSSSTQPRLTALVYAHMHEERPWSVGAECVSDKHASIVSVTPGIAKAHYLARIQQIRAWIGEGEVYQVNSTFPLLVKTEGEPAHLYRQIATRHPVAHAAFIEDVGRTILSFSPELFLQRTGNTLMTRPMKGTAPRSADPDTDRQLGETLHASEKNRAENLMIVDLLRNDLGRLARPGSVRADPLFSLEKYPSVWTMTSTVQAEIAPETSFVEILKALFPCGSVTGAPKIAAMKRIQETEAEPRGLYCGSVGWLAPNGDFSLNVAIRTLVLDAEGQGRYHVGGGIVYDSDPEQEWDECHWKARILNTDS